MVYFHCIRLCYITATLEVSLFLHGLKYNAGNSLGPTEEFFVIVCISSMMTSLVILMSEVQLSVDVRRSPLDT